MKNFYFLVVIFAIAHLNLSAQTKEIDSLKQILKQTKIQTDTNYVNACFDLVYEFANLDIDSAEYYADKGFELAQKADYKLGIANGYVLSGSMQIYRGDFKEAIKKIKQADQVFAEMNNTDKRMQCFNNLGAIYYYTADYDSAMSYFNKALPIAESKKLKQECAIIYGNFGSIHTQKGEFKQAAEQTFKALKIFEELDDKNQIAMQTGNLGTLFKEMRDTVNAVIYFEKSAEFAKKIGDKSTESKALSNLGGICNSQKKYDKAIAYYERSAKLDTENGDKLGISADYSNLAQLYSDTEKYELADAYFAKALNLKTELDDKRGLSVVYFGMAKSFHKRKNRQKALIYAEKGLALNNAISNTIGEIQHNLLLSDIYQASGDYKKGLEFFKQAQTIQDSINSVEISTSIADLQTKYETEKKEQLAKQLTLENELKAAENTKLRNRQAALTLVFGVFILAVALFFIVNKKRQNERMNRMRFEEIGRNNERIAGNLHNGVKNYNSAVKLRIENNVELKKEAELLDTAIVELDYQIRMLHSPEILDAQFDFVAESKAFVNFMQNLNPFAVSFTIENTVKWEKHPYETRIHLFNILKELLANSMKYAQATRIDIRYRQSGKKLIFTYSDNGKGFDSDLLNRPNPSSGGFGLKDIRRRAERVGTEFALNTRLGEGMSVTLTVPEKTNLFRTRLSA